MKILAFFLLLCLPWEIYAVPAQIVVIRHGEKNLKVEEYGLNALGRTRAAALGVLLSQSPELVVFGAPAALFAVHADPVKYDTVRTTETLLELSKLTKLDIQTPFILRDTEALGAEILKNPKYDNKYLVVCWEHHFIPELLEALGVKEKVKVVKSHVFDRMWILQYNPDGTLKSFKNAPQRLLFGDTRQ